MRKSLDLCCFAIAFSLLPMAYGQQPSTPTPEQFRSQVQKVAASEKQWRQIVNSVNLEDLPVPYAIGKRFADNQ